ncbi:hypothetical protein F4777DRAFT_417053 [Nemania sp. FL0916]|nr:hypothetical protein F4777DRAFT_417053 [Nemania sp. FL0916]
MDRHATSPFALKLFYRTSAFHRPDEFTTDSLPPYLTIHTWPDCTLDELTQHIAAADGNLLPDPAIGTRLAYRLIFQDTRGPASLTKYTVKELGSVVIGDGGPGLDPEDVDAERTLDDTEPNKTLADARFVVGDYVACAILPPLSDGSVAPSSSARMGRGTGAGESRLAVGRAPDGTTRDREVFMSRHGRGRGGMAVRGLRAGGMPMGEWRRGEKLPDMPPAPGGRPRNRGRF